MIKYMRLLHRDNLYDPEKAREINEFLQSSEYAGRLRQKHGNGDPYIEAYIFMVESHLRPVLGVIGTEVQGKVILDLGCGSRPSSYALELMASRDPYETEVLRQLTAEGASDHIASYESGSMVREFEPWLCRALHELGAHPIGIDVGYLEGEDFEHYRVNLLDSKALDFMADNSVDMAHARFLFNSTQLKRMNGQGRLLDILIPQLERVVRHSGAFLYEKDR